MAENHPFDLDAARAKLRTDLAAHDAASDAFYRRMDIARLLPKGPVDTLDDLVMIIHAQATAKRCETWDTIFLLTIEEILVRYGARYRQQLAAIQSPARLVAMFPAEFR